MKWALVDLQNKVKNLIAYDGSAPFNVPDRLRIAEVNDWLNMGDDIGAAQPVSPTRPSDADLKRQRNDIARDDIALKGCYLIEKKTNAALTFSDYLDLLESADVTEV